MLLFDDRLYIVDSEPELNRRYADLSLIVRPDARQYPLLDHLLEFKYINLATLGLTGEQVQQQTWANLHALPAVQTKFQEAAKQLQYYQQALTTRYGTQLHLRLHTVVALGFERLVWQDEPTGVTPENLS